MSRPRVTIGITCYNDEAYIETCLRSVLNQTWPEVEVIIVDDCSTDNSRAIIENYADRVRLITHEENSGGYLRGRREVIAAASGAYVGHLDADDFVEPDFVERHVEAFTADSGLDWVAGNLRIVNSDGSETDRWDYKDFPTDALTGLRRGFLTASVPVPKNGLFSMRFLRENKLDWYQLPHTANGSDALTCIKYLECSPKIRLLPYFGLNYRLHGENRCGVVVERIKMTIDIKEYYINHHNELVYLYHPDLLRHPNHSDEYLGLKYYLLAVDFYRTKREFRVPDQFINAATESDIQGSLQLFDEPIRRYAEKSLGYSDTWRQDLEVILGALGSRGKQPAAVKCPAGAPSKSTGAKARFQRMLADNPYSLEALNGLAELAYEAGDAEAAQQYAVTAVKAAPADARTLNNAGAVAFACQGAAEAEILFRRALAADPHNADAHYNLCDLWGQVARQFAPDPQRTYDLLRTVRWIAEYDPDPWRSELMSENGRLRRDLLAGYKARFASTGRRVLLHRPSNGAIKYLMDSWCEVLNFMGIETRLLNWGEKTAPVFEAFRPDLFITVSDPAYVAQLDYDYITNYRRQRRLQIGHITTFEHEFPPCDFLITFHFDPSRDATMSRCEMPLVSLPFAINPLQHYMRPGREVWDYFFVGTNSPRKIERTKDYLIPIVQQYNGILAGTGWNVGMGEMAVKDVAELYNFARIYPNYSTPRHMTEFNEINERAFIIPACGGFQLVDNPVAMRELFTDDEMAIADTPGQYRDMFEYYLANPDQRLPIIRRGMQRVYREYTLFHVLEKIVPFLQAERVPAERMEPSVQGAAAGLLDH